MIAASPKSRDFLNLLVRVDSHSGIILAPIRGTLFVFCKFYKKNIKIDKSYMLVLTRKYCHEIIQLYLRLFLCFCKFYKSF